MLFGTHLVQVNHSHSEGTLALTSLLYNLIKANENTNLRLRDSPHKSMRELDVRFEHQLRACP